MTGTLVISGIVLILIGIGIGMWLRTRGGRKSQWAGFKEYVRDPTIRYKEAMMRREHEEIVAELSEEPPEQLVPMLLDEDLVPVAAPAIRRAGTAVVPHLIEALSAPAYRRPSDEKANESTHFLFRRSSPLVTVLQCLEDCAPPSAVAAVASLVSDPDKEIRKHAALLLGAIASDDAVEPLQKALADDDDYVRSYALMGLLRAQKASKHVSSSFRSRMFDTVLPLVWRPDSTVSGDAPKCLLGLNRERAISVFTAPETLVPGREGLTYVLRALREARVEVAAESLVNLLRRIEPISTEYPNDYVTAEALQLLAVAGQDSEAAEGLIRNGLASKSQKVREGAAEALAALKGIAAPYVVAFDRLERTDWTALTLPQKHVLGVRILIDEVNNGGFEQYFVNSSGDHWPDALAGLQAIGAFKTHKLMQQATDSFGHGGPSTDRDKRHRQLAKVVEKDEEFFSPIEKTFYEDQEDREVLLLLYIIDHEGDFR